MIKYSLRCHNTHSFESWFQSASGFDTLASAGQIACPICGETRVEKSLMAPNLRDSGKPDLTATPTETAMAQMRAQIEANSEYVGLNFVKEARRMHQGDTEARAIYGEAKPEEARALLQEGVPVVPLPFQPKQKSN